MTIRQLSDHAINQIAAGEVIERPASVVKELVENALDAGAGRISVVTSAGGKTLIRVDDDGSGIPGAELPLAVERHCTSKLSEDDLFDIRSLGFRGEALPSIGAIARLSLTSRHAGDPHGWTVMVEGGVKRGPEPAGRPPGTRVEVRDLFFATPARLKFLKSDRAEGAAVTDVVKRLALANPSVRFELSGSDRQTLTFASASGETALAARIAQVNHREAFGLRIGQERHLFAEADPAARAGQNSDVVGADGYIALADSAVAANLAVSRCAITGFRQVTAGQQALLVEAVGFQQGRNPLPGGHAPLGMLACNTLAAAHGQGSGLVGLECVQAVRVRLVHRGVRSGRRSRQPAPDN